MMTTATRRWWKRRDGSDDADDLVPMDTQEQEELVRSLEQKQAHESRRWRRVFTGFLLGYAAFLVYSSFHHAWSPWELRYHAYFMEDMPAPMVIIAGNGGYLIFTIGKIRKSSLQLARHMFPNVISTQLVNTETEAMFIVTQDWVAALACLFAVKGLVLSSSSSRKWMWYSFYVGMAVAVFWTYYLLKLPRIRWDAVWLPFGPLIASTLSLYVDHTLLKSMQDISTLRSYMYNFKSL